MTAVKELAHILATMDQYEWFGCKDKRFSRLSRQDAERMLQTLEKVSNGEFIFEFKDIVDKEGKEEQQRLSKLWELGCQRLGLYIQPRDRGDAAWIARPTRETGKLMERLNKLNAFLSELQIYIKVLEAYEFAAGSPDKALVLQKCVEELKGCVELNGCECRPPICRTYAGGKNLQYFYGKVQELLQAQSRSTLESLSQYLGHDVDGLVTSSPSRYVVWAPGGPRRASHLVGERLFAEISWCTWIKSLVDEVRLTEDNHQQLKGLLQEVGLELKKLPLRDAAPKTDAADVLSDASWVQVQSEIASICESSDSSTSGISVETFGCPCFMTDSVFKAPDGSFVSSQQLVKGSKVLGFDGSILTVNNPPEQHQARATVILYAAGAKLQVTPDHRVVLATSSPAVFWREVKTCGCFL